MLSVTSDFQSNRDNDRMTNQSKMTTKNFYCSTIISIWVWVWIESNSVHQRQIEMEKYRLPNRIHLLRAREYGLEDSLISLEQSRRLVDLTLCKYRNLTSYHRSSISTMDLDPFECR